MPDTSPDFSPKVDSLKICNNVTLRLVQPDDAEWILPLRLDASRNQHLSEVAPDLALQREWILRYQEREKAGDEYYFSIESEKTSTPFGTLRLYGFPGDSFFWGSWIIDPDAPSSFGIESALCAYEIGFFVLGFKLARGEVRSDNVSVKKFHLRFGCVFGNLDGSNHPFKLALETYLDQRKRYLKFYRKDWLAAHPCP